jgi:hypothetical protein
MRCCFWGVRRGMPRRRADHRLVLRGSPDPAAMTDRRSPEFQETFGQAKWLGPPLFAAVPETGHSQPYSVSNSWRNSLKWMYSQWR